MSAQNELRVPDIGDFANIPIIELLVKPGDLIAVDDPIATLESDKATLDVPSSLSGRVLTIAVGPGSLVSQGTLLLTVAPLTPAKTAEELRPASADLAPAEAESAVDAPPPRREQTGAELIAAVPPQQLSVSAHAEDGKRIYASPSVRRLGTQLGINLSAIKGSGPRGRLLVEDLHLSVRAQLREHVTLARSTEVTHADVSLPDFSSFGEVERKPLTRIRQKSGATLARNWISIPHVTNFDEADITNLEGFRNTVNVEQIGGPKITLLTFLVKAIASVLKAMPQFNASLDKDHLIIKKYVHVGIAVDTPNGLLVPVIRDADQLGLLAIASKITASAQKAREGKLRLADMEGGCFTISSLGGIGGTGFTPIINAPELAILGAGKAQTQPRWDGEQFLPRLILPISLSWDHRALDGVAAARFLVLLVRLLEDYRRLLL